MGMKVHLHRGFSDGSRISGQGCPFYQNYTKGSLENGCGAPRTPLGITHFFPKLGVLLVVVLALSGSLYWAASISAASGGNVIQGYRRLQENLVAELSLISDMSLGGAKLRELEFCPPEYEDYVPCYCNVSDKSDVVDPVRRAEYDQTCIRGQSKDQNCLVLPPRNYRIPLRWPTGRDFIWKENVKITGHEFSSGSLMKRMMVEEEQISFRSDSLMVDGVEDYAHQIAEMIGLINESNFNEAGVRTVLDIGCGFGSFGAYLFTKQVLTLCIAKYESSGSQVQITLERGIPAILASFTSKQLPFPYLSFDMLHCTRCGIQWEMNDGIFLVEVDRLLRPGGYFVWTSASSSHRMARDKDNEKWAFIRDFAESLCWDMLSQQDDTIVWKKTSRRKSYNYRKFGPALCEKSHDSESPFYQPLQHCIRGTRSQRWIPIEDRRPWPLQANLNSTELNLYGVHPEDFAEDAAYWNTAIHNYWSLLSPLIFSDHPKRPGDEDPSPPFNMLRNVLDMNARFGGLNAALLDAGKSVWVMNVVPTGGPDHLPLILDRGFIGVQHDWCEAFPTYPRTYDMVHAEGLLSLEAHQRRRCSITDILLEVDRILRPEGWLILHDAAPLIKEARTMTTQLKWDARLIDLESNSDAKLLICQKPFFRRQQY